MTKSTVISVEQGNVSTWSSCADWHAKLAKSALSRDPCRMEHLPVPTADKSNKGLIAAELIDEALRNVTGRKVLVGHSTECAYINLWARIYGPQCGIDPDDLHLLLMANPERAYGGWTRVPKRPPIPWDIAAFGPPGLPPDAPWPTTDFAIFYDVVADAPSAADPNFWAVANGLTTGVAVHLNLTQPNYLSTPLNAPGTQVFVEGAITYLLAGKPNVWIEGSFDRPDFALMSPSWKPSWV